MMANSEMPGTQGEAAARAVGTDEADAAAQPAQASAATPDVPRPRRQSGDARSPLSAEAGQPADQSASRRQPDEADQRRPRPRPEPRQPAAYDPEPERMPLIARVLLADVAVAVVGLVLLFVIEVQRFGDASLHLRRQAWIEDLVVLFLVAAVFAVVACLLLRAGHARVAIVQAVVTALVLVAAITSAATGDPKPTPADTPTTTGSSGNPG